MKRLAFSLACASLCFGQSIGSSDARAKKIIDDAVQALGGDKFLNMEDRVEFGRAYSFYREQLSGLSIAKIYTRYITIAEGRTGQDLGVREKQAFGKAEDSGVLFTEDGAWEYTYRGARIMEEDRIARYKDSTLRNIFYILRQRLREPGMIFESRGADVMLNVPVEIVDITDSENRVITVYFHQSTKLPVKETWSWRDPKTKERNDEVTTFTRYRETGGGVQWPYQIERQRNGEKVYEIFSESVTINQNLSDSAFASPALMAAPPKAVSPGKKK
jgi:hypothetical protein